ncbi:unnamed protein product [Gongylonema pulchrum]|uniref:EF-hand domain-containing protein n=1 Tax=Gongylonema pulchrum TaxID=637853 RepID=A0A183DMX6_9BILA|nr:unnamed protein product [Gongylonema pulchrum]
MIHYQLALDLLSDSEKERREMGRNLLQFQSPVKSAVFADWASGVSSTLDPEIVNKHISAMVEAVFKHYDHNRDGSISQTEFKQISTNFPFIAPFGTIDVDK